jgi:short subunit fatty acids transporter
MIPVQKPLTKNDSLQSVHFKKNYNIIPVQEPLTKSYNTLIVIAFILFAAFFIGILVTRETSKIQKYKHFEHSLLHNDTRYELNKAAYLE